MIDIEHRRAGSDPLELPVHDPSGVLWGPLDDPRIDSLSGADAGTISRSWAWPPRARTLDPAFRSHLSMAHHAASSSGPAAAASPRGLSWRMRSWRRLTATPNRHDAVSPKALARGAPPKRRRPSSAGTLADLSMWAKTIVCPSPHSGVS